VQLYDFSQDISEKTNLAEQHPDVVARLSKLVASHQEALRNNRRPVGKAD